MKENAVLQCAVMQDDPFPTFTWYFNDQKLDQVGGNYTTVETNTSTVLTVLNVAETDAGEYTCVAENELGRCNASTILKVQGLCVCVCTYMCIYMYCAYIVYILCLRFDLPGQNVGTTRLSLSLLLHGLRELNYMYYKHDCMCIYDMIVCGSTIIRNIYKVVLSCSTVGLFPSFPPFPLAIG